MDIDDLSATNETSIIGMLRGSQSVEAPIIRTEDVFDASDPALTLMGGGVPFSPRRLIFVDGFVWQTFGDRIQEYFSARGLEATFHPIDLAEHDKNITQLIQVLTLIDEFEPLRRSEPILVIGGGVLLDVVGLACAVFRRGSPYIRVPTTLLGQVDAGIGLKTGVNFGRGKNRLGAYHPPLATILDSQFLSTLPARQLANGLAEMIKVAIACDAALFASLEAYLNTGSRDLSRGEALEHLVDRAAASMVAELSANPFEAELARTVDFGHSFGPAIELEESLGLLHGESVAIDASLSSAIALERGILSTSDFKRIRDLILGAGLPLDHVGITAEQLFQGLLQATRHRNGKQNLPVPHSCGGVTFVQDCTVDEVARALELIRRGHA